MRTFAVLVLTIGVLSAATGSQAASQTQLRVLYAGDWTGSMQIFAADPSGHAPLAQLTFSRVAGSCTSPAACGFTRPQPSPDGRWLAYSSGDVVTAFQQPTLWLAHADGRSARAIGPAFDAAWSPDSRRLAYSAPDGIHLRTMNGVDRIVDRQHVAALRFSPDGTKLAFDGVIGLTVLTGRSEHVLVSDEPSAFAWSPDGRRIAYGTNSGISFIPAAGGRARLVYPWPKDVSTYSFRQELAFSPAGSVLAFAIGGTLGFLDMRTLHVRIVHATGHDITWSPDGRSVLLVQGGEDPDGFSISTGDVESVSPNGHISTLVSGSKPYGGQIISAAWTTTSPGVSYRSPQTVDGVFAGGPVQELAADGGRAAFIACGGVSAWTPATDEIVAVEHQPDCWAANSRAHVYSLALAGDRLVWLEKGWGLSFQWSAREATLGASPITLGSGYGALGGPPTMALGAPVGAGSLLVMSGWALRYDNGARIVDQQSIERVDAGGCPCATLSSSTGPYTPLDVDGDRIVVSGDNETRILAADGTILLSLRVPTHAAQLSGTALVLAASGQLRVYDAVTGELRAAWPLPAQPVGHECDSYGDPSCKQRAPLVLDDVSHGLAVYTLDDQVHLLRLNDGADRLVGPGSVARFMDAGLVYADGARIHLVPYDGLPLVASARRRR
jgi:WD40-like Beta Propeller Repeat